MKAILVFTLLCLSAYSYAGEPDKDTLLSELQISEYGGNLFGPSFFGNNDLISFNESEHYLSGPNRNIFFETNQCKVIAGKTTLAQYGDKGVEIGDTYAVRAVGFDRPKNMMRVIAMNNYERPAIILIDCFNLEKEDFKKLTVGDFEMMLENKVAIE